MFCCTKKKVKRLWGMLSEMWQHNMIAVARGIPCQHLWKYVPPELRETHLLVWDRFYTLEKHACIKTIVNALIVLFPWPDSRDHSGKQPSLFGHRDGLGAITQREGEISDLFFCSRSEMRALVFSFLTLMLRPFPNVEFRHFWRTGQRGP